MVLKKVIILADRDWQDVKHFTFTAWKDAAFRFKQMNMRGVRIMEKILISSKSSVFIRMKELLQSKFEEELWLRMNLLTSKFRVDTVYLSYYSEPRYSHFNRNGKLMPLQECTDLPRKIRD